MPTITATPVQVSNTPPYRQGGGTNFGEHNPFYLQVGSNLYQVLAQTQTAANPRIGVFKRAVSDIGGAWVDQSEGLDSANSPDIGSQTGILHVFDDTALTGKICILYLLTGFTDLKIVEFDTATDTWGTPTASVTVQNFSQRWGFTRRSDGTYVVLGNRTGHLYYILNSGGTWGSITDTSLAVNSSIEQGGLLDSSDRSWVVVNETIGNDLTLHSFDSSNVLSSGVTVDTGVTLSGAGHPTLILEDSDTIAVGYIFGSDVRAGHLTPLSAPVLTATDTVFSAGATNEVPSYANVVLGITNILNCFFVIIDRTTTPTKNEIRQSVFDGVSSWSAPTVYYDEIANPVVNDLPPGDIRQFIHTLQTIELPQGWSAAFACETENQGIPEGPPPDLWCTGEFTDPEQPEVDFNMSFSMGQTDQAPVLINMNMAFRFSQSESGNPLPPPGPPPVPGPPPTHCHPDQE